MVGLSVRKRMSKSGVNNRATGAAVLEPPVVGVNGAGPGSLSELTAYLANLGLDDVHLANVMSLLPTANGENGGGTIKERNLPVRDGAQVSSSHNGQPDASVNQKTVKLFLAEEQQLLMQAYQAFFKHNTEVQALGCAADTSSDALVEAVSSLGPDVLLLGVKALRPSTVENLEALRIAHPGLGVVLLFAFYDTQGIRALREFSRDASAGRAYLLKHTIDTMDQLTHAITSVAEGRMIVDPSVMEELIKTGDAQSEALRDLTPRALEVLHLVSRGYRNETIAGVLSRDVKTIERHINNIYGTLLNADDDAKHPRVRAALMYLRATGVLSTEQLIED